MTIPRPKTHALLAFAAALAICAGAPTKPHADTVHAKEFTDEWSTAVAPHGPRLAAPTSTAPLGPDHLQKKHLSTSKHEPFGARSAPARRPSAAGVMTNGPAH